MNSFLKRYYRQIQKLPHGHFRFIPLLMHYQVWKKTLQPGRSTLNDGMPWITFDAISFLRKNLNKNMTVFEYGSGGSSIFFSELTKEVISVEHDKEWFNLVKTNIEKRGIKNWKGLLREPQIPPAGFIRDSEDPSACSTSDLSNLNYSFSDYVHAIDSFPENSFDLIVVDGRSRPSCLKYSIPKLKKGGFILLDNSDRKTYQLAIKEIISNNFSIEVYRTGPTAYSHEFTQTLIKRKLF